MDEAEDSDRSCLQCGGQHLGLGLFRTQTKPSQYTNQEDEDSPTTMTRAPLPSYTVQCPSQYPSLKLDVSPLPDITRLPVPTVPA